MPAFVYEITIMPLLIDDRVDKRGAELLSGTDEMFKSGGD